MTCPPARIIPSVHGPPPKLNLRASDTFVAGSSSPSILEEDTDKGSNQFYSYVRVVSSVHGCLPDLGLTRSELQLSPGSKDYKTLRPRAFNVIEPGLSDTNIADQDESTISGSAPHPEDESRQRHLEKRLLGAQKLPLSSRTSSLCPQNTLQPLTSGSLLDTRCHRQITSLWPQDQFAAAAAIGNVRKNERATVTEAATNVNVVEKYGG